MSGLLRVLAVNSTVLLLLIVSSGCRTTTIPTFDPIPVPPGLTTNQVEVAILAALANTPVPRELSDGAAIADEAMTAFLGRFDTKELSPPDMNGTHNHDSLAKSSRE
jgi:hypothetical protein